jgi:aldehyde:ferredoxin oxidoreductase
MSVITGGLTGVLLRVDLTTGSITKTATPVALFERYLGARGVGAHMLFHEVVPEVDPLGPDNKLIFLTGPLEGTLAPGANKITVSFLSPLSETYSFSLCGGHLAAELKFAGYDGVIIEGRSEKPVYLVINNGRVSLRSAAHLWGKQTHDTEEQIRADLADPDVHVAVIGPGGEKLVRFACIQADRHREFGRGGGGAVMGSKNLKAIAVRGTGQVAVANPAALEKVAVDMYAMLKQHPKAKARRTYGTVEMVEGTNKFGYWATRNFQTGFFEGTEKLTGPRMKENFYVGDTSCYGCTVACGKVSKVGMGQLAGQVIEGSEFESLGLLGPNCGVGDPEAIVAAVALCDVYGIDTMSAGITVSLAMEAFEKGVITREDTGGLDLSFGNGEALLAILEQIGQRKGLGDLLAEGSLRAAQRMGIPELAMQVKGMELATYEPRGVVGMGLSYAISPKGGHHMIAPTMGAETAGDPANRLLSKGKAALVRDTQFIMAVVDSLSLCASMRFVLGPQMMLDLYAAVTGYQLEVPAALMIGERISNLERLYNVRRGFDRAADSLPPRLVKELMPSGPSAGNTVPLDVMLDEYYALMGWDHDGRPQFDRIQQLGLEAEAAMMVSGPVG